MLKWTRERAPRRMVGTLSNIDDRKRVEGAAGELLDRLQQIARSAPGVLFQYRSTRQGGQFLYVSERCTGLRWLRVTSTARAETAEATLWHGYIEDITEARQLAQAREEAAAARAANSAKTEFLARMSHELRTPLNAVLGFSQLMEMDTREPLTAEQRRRVGFIREAGTHLLQMIGDLPDLTRIESGKLALTLGPLALEPLLRECLEMLHPQAHAGGVRLLPLQVEPGLRAVADTGVGMAAGDLRNLFEPFNRLAHGQSKIEGTGIGLAVTKRLVELMGGRIEVRSVVNVGSTFSVSLPAPLG